MQATTFWALSALFLLLQIALVGWLLRQRRALLPGSREAAVVQTELVWTLVPAALVVALALMAAGLGRASWSRPRLVDAPAGVEARGLP